MYEQAAKGQGKAGGRNCSGSTSLGVCDSARELTHHSDYRLLLTLVLAWALCLVYLFRRRYCRVAIGTPREPVNVSVFEFVGFPREVCRLLSVSLGLWVLLPRPRFTGHSGEQTDHATTA